MGEEYTCANCKGRFKSEWSEEEAKEEFHRNFPGRDINNATVICDDCYRDLIVPHLPN